MGARILGSTLSLEAELWGIFIGLELVQNQSMEALELDLDSGTAVAMINADSPEHSPHKILIQECKALLASTGRTLKHALREGDKVADRLANMRVGQEDTEWCCTSSSRMTLFRYLKRT